MRQNRALRISAREVPVIIRPVSIFLRRIDRHDRIHDRIRPENRVTRQSLAGGLVAVVLFALTFPAGAAWRETDETVKSRGETSIHALIACNLEKTGDQFAETCSDTPAHIAVFFPGAEGRVRPAREGVSQHGARPSTMGLLAEQVGMAVALGLPSDQPRGLPIAWRLSPEHVGDAGAVIDALVKRHPRARLTLIGMSAGSITLSAVAEAIARRGAPKLNGVVVMSGIASAVSDERLAALREAKVPVLFVHHKRDSCTPFRDIEAIARRYELIAFDDVRQPVPVAGTRDCNPGSAHVFGGQEAEVYGRIAAWIKQAK